MWRGRRRPTSRRSIPGTPTQAPMAAVNLGVLLEEQGDASGAKAAYQQAIDSGHADAAPMAAVNLGTCWRSRGMRRARRRPTSRRSTPGTPTRPHGGVQPWSSAGGAGGCEGAKAAYRQAIDSGHADAAPLAAVGLGDLLREQGDAEGAKAAYQQAIDSGHADAALLAADSLGDLLREEGM